MKHLFACIALGCILLSSSALAEQLSKKQAVEKAKAHTPGKVLSVKTKQGKNSAIHHVKVLTDKGRVKTVRINAKSGKIIQKQKD